ncbi:MAG: polysaccharide deacetylase family protein [Candidatus Sumerlaeota bacterium]|nr:polysaccharide deacetylase family protein [Candidatus Sumerlaeota bacterium]
MPEATGTYSQEFAITFHSEDAAKAAVVELAPLYDDYAWSTGSRWDDCNPDDTKMRDVLEKHGYHATWYLNSPTIHGGDFAPYGKGILKGGNSIGGHGWSHPKLSYMNCNRLFEEVARTRVAWEAAADTQVTCYAFAYCDFRNPMMGNQGQIDLNRALRRAGYYLSGERLYNDDLFTDMVGMLLLPGDGAEIDEYMQRALADEAAHREFPMLSHTMHVWHRTPEAWEKFEAQLDKYGHNPDWWHCNHNQYAAYRYQSLHTTLAHPLREGKTLRVKIQRPRLLDLNDSTPLTVRLKNVGRKDVASLQSETADCVPSDRKTDVFLFHLFHDRSRSLPEKTGLVSNAENRAALADRDEDADFPGLKGLLSFDGKALRLILRNQTSAPFKDVQVIYRLPLAWKEGLIRRVLKEDIKPGAQWEDIVTPSGLTTDYRYTAGTAYYQAQVDFLVGTEAGRLHLDCHVRNAIERDASYPQGGFSRLGLIPDADMDMDKVVDTIRRDEFLTEPWALQNGAILDWTSADDTPFTEPFLDPELIRTYGSFNCKEAGYYILQSEVSADREQPVQFRRTHQTVQRIFLNGVEVSGGAARLRQGPNRLVAIYHTAFSNKARFSNFHGEHAGCFLRLVKPGTTERLAGLRFDPAIRN